MHKLLKILLVFLFCWNPQSVSATGKHIVRSNYANYIEKVRLKDICSFEGVRENQLVGYGLVVGLNGTGDTLASSPHTQESLTSMLERLGVNIREGAIPAGKNVAAVMVTATLHSFARYGSKIDVSVSAVGDAKDLRGGMLLVTPLMGADGEVYAVAQGSVNVSGLVAGGGNATQTRGIPTSGFISNGAIIEKEIGFELHTLKTLNLALRNPDFTTAKRIANKLNEYFNDEIADATDPSTIRLRIPEHFHHQIVDFMTEVEQIRIRPDQTARVIIDDTNGVIVMGNNVRISPVALTHGSVTIQVTETPQVSQPNNAMISSGASASAAAGARATTNNNSADFVDQTDSLEKIFAAQLTALNNQKTSQINIIRNDSTLNSFEITRRLSDLDDQYRIDIATLQAKQNEQRAALAKQQLAAREANTLNPGRLGSGDNDKTLLNAAGARTVVTSLTDAQISEETGKFAIVDSGVTLEQLVNALNALGIVPKDMGAILRAIKSAGALQAEIVNK